MTMHQQIKQYLQSYFKSLEHLEVINDSAQHHGHAGDDGSGQTHFRVVIVADDFFGANRVARQRMVYEALAPCFAEGLHAVSISASTRAEHQKNLK
jgi:BolA family transcriptional regulator, general stress-responsive regulator